MTDVSLDRDEVLELQREHEEAVLRSAAAAAQGGAGEGAPLAPPPEPEVVHVDAAQLRPLIDLSNLFLVRFGAEPISPFESQLWCKSAAPVMEKYGGKLPFFEETVLVLTSAAVFGPRVWQVRARAELVAQQRAAAIQAAQQRKQPEQQQEQQQ